MSMEKYYNMSQKLLYAESVQKGRIVRNAKRPKKSTSFLRRNASHPLWWDVLNSVVLQKTQSQVDAAKPCTFSSTQQSLYSRGAAFSSFAYHNSRSWTSELHQNTTIQWLIPSNSRIEKLSKCNHLAPFSLKTYSPSAKTDTFSPRSTSAEDVILSSGAIRRNIRLRYHYSNRIWEIRRSPQRIQSIQARSTVISSLSLLRGPYSGLSARKISSWRRTHWHRKEKVHRRSFSQITFLYIQDKDTWRLQVVRPRNSSSSRREESRLCHRSQSQPTHPAYSRRTSLSRIQERLGGSRIQIPTSPIYISSFHRGAKTATGEGRQPAYALYLKETCLPCDSHKSPASSGKRLEVLLRPRQNRAKYQRAEMGLLSFQDTHKELFGKQGVFPSSFIRLQYRKLVQTAMSAKTISIRHITDYSQRTFSITRQTSKIWQQKLTPIAETLCLQLGVRLCN